MCLKLIIYDVENVLCIFDIICIVYILEFCSNKLSMYKFLL